MNNLNNFNNFAINNTQAAQTIGGRSTNLALDTIEGDTSIIRNCLTEIPTFDYVKVPVITEETTENSFFARIGFSADKIASIRSAAKVGQNF